MQKLRFFSLNFLAVFIGLALSHHVCASEDGGERQELLEVRDPLYESDNSSTQDDNLNYGDLGRGLNELNRRQREQDNTAIREELFPEGWSSGHSYTIFMEQ